MGKKRREIWRAGLLCLFWTIWKVRNKMAFEDVELSMQKLKRYFNVHKGWTLNFGWLH